MSITYGNPLTCNGNVSIGSSMQNNRTVVNSSTYTIGNSDLIIGVTYTSTGSVTITLPAVSNSNAGRLLHIVDEGGNAGINNITINVNNSGTETINGNTSASITSNYSSISIYNNGSTKWFII